MKHRGIRIALIFSLLVFGILIVTMFATISLMMIGLHLGIIRSQEPKGILVAFAFISVVLGTILSRHMGRRPINTIIEISEATKEIAKGNFDVRLNEEIRAAELRTMAQNFNRMTRELGNIEMFRNDFIENVSHEFKTPLTAIEGYVTLLQNKSLSEERRDVYIQKILRNTKRLAALTGNVLLLSRIENQEFELKKEAFSLDEQIREIILMMESQWSEKQLDLDIDMDSSKYVGNQELLAQVWQNVLGNAVKFVHPGGQIRILLRQSASETRVAIADNGPGMSPEVMERIYEKFYQGDPSHTGSGNGLGLTLAKRIVALHGGSIEVSSKEGKGTTFTVILPSV